MCLHFFPLGLLITLYIKAKNQFSIIYTFFCLLKILGTAVYSCMYSTAILKRHVRNHSYIKSEKPFIIDCTSVYDTFTVSTEKVFAYCLNGYSIYLLQSQIIIGLKGKLCTVVRLSLSLLTKRFHAYTFLTENWKAFMHHLLVFIGVIDKIFASSVRPRELTKMSSKFNIY